MTRNRLNPYSTGNEVVGKRWKNPPRKFTKPSLNPYSTGNEVVGVQCTKPDGTTYGLS